ncbi:MAG: hypothetical protein M1155_01220 [Patescibacteria group bacterium]|nr:hypothetical protein [Patescibacteria group bacterium]
MEENNKRENVQDKNNADDRQFRWHDAMQGKDFHRFCKYRWWIFLKIVLGLIILGAVFGIGVKVGEFKSLISRYNYGRPIGNHEMFYRNFNSSDTQGCAGMMNLRNGTSTQQ